MYFASEGVVEFAAADWGPQDLRAVLGRPAAVGLAAGGDTDIRSAAGLRGKKIGFVKANPSIDLNIGAVLAFAGLSEGDIKKVVYPSYGAMLKAFVAGDIDAAPAIPTSSGLRKAEAGRGVRWVNVPASDKAGWARLRAFSTVHSPTKASVGVAASKDAPAELLGYRYPQLATYANVSEETVYNMAKALDQSFDIYKKATKVTGKWKVSISGTPPAGAPFHAGAIRYLKEVGVWSAEHDKWNEARLSRANALKSAWTAARAKAKAEGISDDAWPAFWKSYRASNVK